MVVSRSYGPGRYDPAYEVRGVDYPLPYVRWTERRNMSSFLDLIARGEVKVEPLITQRFPIAEAERAYDIVTGEDKTPAIAIVLEYNSSGPPSLVSHCPPSQRHNGRTRSALGSSARDSSRRESCSPQFLKHRQVRFVGVYMRLGTHQQARGGALRRSVLHQRSRRGVGRPLGECRSDRDSSRPACGLDPRCHPGRQGRLSEKPLATNRAGLAEVETAIQEMGGARLMVGLQPGGSPSGDSLPGIPRARPGPIHLTYRVNAGRLPPDSWALDPVAGEAA
mgnify:CR=1 FL=1